MPKRLLSTKEVSEITGWSREKVLGLIHSGRLAAVNTSTGVRPTWSISFKSLYSLLDAPKRPYREPRRGNLRQVKSVF